MKNTEVSEIYVAGLLYDFHKIISSDIISKKEIRNSLDDLLSKNNISELKKSDIDQNPYVEFILNHFTENNRSTYMMATEIIDIVSCKEGLNDINQKQFGIALRRIFGKSMSKKIKGISRKMYHVGIK